MPDRRSAPTIGGDRRRPGHRRPGGCRRPHDRPSAEKPVEQWVTGDEPATGAQRSHLATLAREADVDVPDELSKAEASRLIDDLRPRTEPVDPV